MPVSEPLERQKLRAVLRAITTRVKKLEAHGLDSNEWKLHGVKIQRIDFDENLSPGPTFFTPCSPSLLLNPDDDYDRETEKLDDYDPLEPEHFRTPKARSRYLAEYFVHYTCACNSYRTDRALRGLWSSVSIGDKPFVGLHQFSFPEFVTRCAAEVEDSSYPHMRAAIYNDVNGENDIILRSEVMVALRLSIAQLRRARFMEHIIAPILIFSFMGPQHVRLTEAHFKDGSLVMHPSQLFDLRKKDENVIKTLGQWWFARPTGNTRGEK